MQKIDLNHLQLIISKLKLKRPNMENNQQCSQYNKDKNQNLNHDYSFSKQQPQQSIIQDNYSDSNCFSFYNIQRENNVQFNAIKDNSQFLNSQISQFGSIIDKLKTQGDSPFSEKKQIIYKSQRDREKLNQKVVVHKVAIDKQIYLSQKQLKPHSKTYKNISSMKKIKIKEPIAIPNKLNADKQNFHIFSNQSHHYSVKKLKKTFKENTISNQKINQQTLKKPFTEIKLGHGERAIQFKSIQHHKTASPLPFRHSKIEPHKFSSYKMKLF